MDALSELLDTCSFNKLLSGMDADSARNVHNILDSLSRHPRAKKLEQSLRSVKFTSLESIHSEILLILLGHGKLTALFRRLWSAFFPWYYDLTATSTSPGASASTSIGTSTSIDTSMGASMGTSLGTSMPMGTAMGTAGKNAAINKTAVSRMSTAGTKTKIKTLYDLGQIHYLDKKSIQLLAVLDKTGHNLKAKDQMQYILKSLKNHSDSNIMFYYRIKDSMNLLDVVDKFFNGKYSDSEGLKVDILHVFSNFLEEFPMDQYGLKRGLAHFEYLWNYFFPSLSSRTRRKKTL
jgi:hypothetical protein